MAVRLCKFESCPGHLKAQKGRIRRCAPFFIPSSPLLPRSSPLVNRSSLIVHPRHTPPSASRPPPLTQGRSLNTRHFKPSPTNRRSTPEGGGSITSHPRPKHSPANSPLVNRSSLLVHRLITGVKQHRGRRLPPLPPPFFPPFPLPFLVFSFFSISPPHSFLCFPLPSFSVSSPSFPCCFPSPSPPLGQARMFILVFCSESSTTFRL